MWPHLPCTETAVRAQTHGSSSHAPLEEHALDVEGAELIHGLEGPGSLKGSHAKVKFEDGMVVTYIYLAIGRGAYALH